MLMLNAISIFAMQLLVPSMPFLQEYFDTSPYEVQLTLTVFMFGFAISQIFYGPLSDRFGRKSIILWSIVIFIFGSILAIFAKSIEVLIFSRFIQSIGAAGGMVLPPAVLRDVYGERESVKAISWISIISGVAALLAPYLGGLFHELYGWKFGMFFLICIGIVLLFVSIIFLPESRYQDKQYNFKIKNFVNVYLKIFKNNIFLNYFIILSLVNATFYALFAGGVYIVVENLKLSPTKFGLVMFPLVAFFVVSAYVSVRVDKYIQPKIIMLFGSFCTLFSAFMILFINVVDNLTLSTLIISSLFLGWGNGHIIPLATAEAINLFPEKSGTVSASIGTGAVLSGAIVSLLFGLLYNGSPYTMTILMLFTSLAAVIYCIKHFFNKKGL